MNAKEFRVTFKVNKEKERQHIDVVAKNKEEALEKAQELVPPTLPQGHKVTVWDKEVIRFMRWVYVKPDPIAEVINAAAPNPANWRSKLTEQEIDFATNEIKESIEAAMEGDK